jgi:DNA-binding transcriptional LysR family regulator
MSKSRLAQLEAFYWVARLGGFRAAAEQLHRTQPTISLRIKELEDALGVSLFDRSGSRIQLTAASREMMSYVEKILALTNEMEDRLRQTDPLHGLCA